MRAYVVKTGDGYFYPYRGAVSFTAEEKHAGHFLAVDEAHLIAQMFGYTQGQYQIIPVEIQECQAG